MQEIAEKDPSSLEKAVSTFLNDNPRPGQPMHYTDEQIIKILETACRNPEEPGYETSHWILNLLANVIIEGKDRGFHIRQDSKPFFKYVRNPLASRPLLASFLRKSGFSGDFCGKSE